MGSFIGAREDVSDWLIHFVRDRDPDVDFPGNEELYERLVGNLIEPDADAKAVLWSIITIGALLPHWSFRTLGKTVRSTIYGDRPVVCFTEAPLHDFAQYVKDRGNTDKCSPFGICVLKRDAFAAGARPVIYALSGEGAPPEKATPDGLRFLDEGVLPLAEQYRYVAYDPNRSRPLDFTHEREWRWRPTTPGHRSHEIWYDGPDGVGPYPGLSLFRDDSFFSTVGIIVPTRDDANRFAEMILGYKAAGTDKYDAPYGQRVLANTFIVPLEEALDHHRRIDELSVDFRIVATREEANDKLIQKVRTALETARQAGNAASAAFEAQNPNFADVCGFAWIDTHAPTSAVTDALIKLGVLKVYGESHRVSLKLEHGLSLTSAEKGTEAAAKTLTQLLGQQFGTGSRMD